MIRVLQRSALIIAVIFPFLTHAVEYGAGIKTGLSMADFWSKDGLAHVAKSSMRTDLCGAVFAVLKFNRTVSALVEIDYAKKGERVTLKLSSMSYSGGQFVTADKSWDELLKFDYWEIPVFFKVNVLGKPRLKLGLYAGPYFDALAQAKEYINDNGAEQWLDVKKYAGNFDIGVSLGLDAEVPFRHGNLVFDIRFSGGFLTTDKVTDAQKQVSPNAKSADRKNRSFSCMVGYAYSL